MSTDDPEQQAFDELSFYTLAHPSRNYIHQHAVDAFAVQRATEQSKPIGVAFGLFGLCLHLERGLTGKEVQRAHMQLAKRRKQWPRFELPPERSAVRVAQVVAAEPGPERDAAIESWCRSVWEACRASHAQVRELLE